MTDLADGRDKGHVVLSLLIMNNKHAATIVHQFIHLQKKNPHSVSGFARLCAGS